MLALSEFPVAQALKLLTGQDIDATFIVTTPTGLAKSILDATDDVRTYFAEQKLHDYQQQAQRPADKVVLGAFFVQPLGLEPARVSLYQPETKKVDPRLRLGEGNLEALFLPSQVYALA